MVGGVRRLSSNEKSGRILSPRELSKAGAEEYPLTSPDGRFVANGPGKRPYYNGEGDYCCSICGEPWGYFGIKEGLRIGGDGDMPIMEANKFMVGEGCPSCDFGKESNFMFHKEDE